MHSKIFRSILCAIIMVLGMHGLAGAQSVSPDREKDMDAKLQQMDVRLKVMQQKLDSMNALNDHQIKNIRINGVNYATPKGLKIQQGNVYAYPDGKNLDSVISVFNNGYAGINGVTNVKILKSAKGNQPVNAMVPATVQGWSINSTTTNGSGNAYVLTHVLTTTGNINGNQAIQAVRINGLNTMFSSISSEDSQKKLDARIKSGEVKEKIKTYTKSYPVKPGDKLMVDNRYGKITVNTWSKKEFKVVVEIKGIANEDDDAQKLLDGISISDNKDGSVITFTTKIESQNRSSGTWTISNGKSYVSKSVVNYTVYMPSKNSLEIKNRFGTVNLPDFGGKLMVNMQYGTFNAKNLSNNDNEITTQSTDVNIGSITGSTLICRYGNSGNGVKIGNANNLKFDAQFVNADIAKIKTAGNISIRYGGGLTINDLDKNVKTLTVNSSFAPITLSSKTNFDFSVSLRGNNRFTYNDDKVKVLTKYPDDERRPASLKTYTGYTGKANPDTKVTITNTYQGVQFL